jgi:hypothetical protein
VDPSLPTESEHHIRMFVDDGSEVLDFDKPNFKIQVIAYFMCKKCPRMRFTDYFKFKYHFLMVHENNRACLSFTCSICYATFMSASDYATHLRDNKHLSKYRRWISIIYVFFLSLSIDIDFISLCRGSINRNISV